jgi:hypothetical protein
MNGVWGLVPGGVQSSGPCAQQSGAGLDLATAPDRFVLNCQPIGVEIGGQTRQERGKFATLWSNRH